MQHTTPSLPLPMSIARATATRMASNAPVDANVATDARPAHKRRASSTEDVVPGSAEIAGLAKRRRTSAIMKMESTDAMLVGHIDANAPAVGGDGKRPRPATRTPARTRATRAIRASIPPAKQTTGFKVRSTPLDCDAPATSDPLPTHGNPAFPTLLNPDWRATALPLNLDWTAIVPPQSGAGPLERGALCARADPLYASVDPMLVVAYERSRPRMPLDETRQFDPVWVTYNPPAPLELSGTDVSVLRPYGMLADGDVAIAHGYLRASEDADRKPRVLLDLVPTGALDGREALVSAPLRLGDHMPTYDVANLDPALWDDDLKPYVPLDEKRAATDEPLNFEAANTHAPHAGNVAQLLAPARADAPENERTPYVPFNEKLGYITEWRRRVATDAPAPTPIELPAPLELPALVATMPGAYYRADAVGIPVGDPRTRDWVLLPPYDAAPDELARYGMPMSPEAMRAWDEFVATLPPDAYANTEPSAFREDFEPAGSPRARVELGLLTPEEEAAPPADPAVLNALLLDAQVQR